ncbi:MAG TPA: fumarate hydratase [Thermodesulfobacteriota bacterium]|nr:fumarate hydratase [Thermodesulfobacteriota bacterium]
MKGLENKFSEIFYDSLVRGITSISPDILKLMMEAREDESPQGKSMLDAMVQNVELAQKRKKGVCQSPGIPCIYLRGNPEMIGFDIKKIMGESIVKATREGYLRPSIVHPLTRKNTGDNSGPGIPNFETEIDPGLGYLEIVVSFKGCGPELFNVFKTFTPESLGKNLEGMKRFLLESVINAGGKPCPPIGLGIGIGGQMDGAAKLSRRAISTRKWDDRNPDPELDRMEQELKARINQLGIGPGGVGGKTTALAVKIGIAYTHTAICPVAVNFHCWVGRRFGFRLFANGTTEEIL